MQSQTSTQISSSVNQSRKFVPRNCGDRRIAGNAYLRSLQQKRRDDEEGDPEDYFMICPPFEVDLEEIGLASQGISVIPDPTDPMVYNVWDYVGTNNYTPADFIEEDKRYGTSRLVPTPQIPKLDMLTAGKSRHIFVTKAALIDPKLVYDRLDERIKMCPAGHKEHNDPNGAGIYQMCASFFWETQPSIPKKYRRLQQIFMPKFMAKKDGEYLWSYFSNGWYKDWDDLQWVDAAFYWKPIDHVDIVKDKSEDKKHVDVVQLAMNLGNNLPFILVDDDTGEQETIK